jgi:hypothetical protein
MLADSGRLAARFAGRFAGACGNGRRAGDAPPIDRPLEPSM